MRLIIKYKRTVKYEPIKSMTKGLSKLQKKIIQIAYRNRGGILARNVLAEVYGFSTTVNIQNIKPGAIVFNRKVIGERKYQAASTATARSFNRLAARGLARRQYSGMSLTEEGVKVAKDLTPET